LAMGQSKSRWARAVALALAGVALPATGDVPESVTIPLKVVQIPCVGVKVGIEVSLGGGPPRLYTFDTGSSGMYAAYNAAWWPTLTPLPGPMIPQSYGSGLQLKANPVATVVGIPTDKGVISYTAEVGQITEASGTTDGEQWLANVAAGKAPLYGMFFGDFGSGLTKPEQGLFAVLPQLPGNLSSGFAVQLGCGGGSSESKVVVGLTTGITSRVTSWVKMEKDPASPPYPGSNRPTFKQAVLNGHFSLVRNGNSYDFTVPAILDTGGGTTNFHQKAPELVVPDAFLTQPGVPSRIAPGTQFRVTAPGTNPSNGFDMSFVTGTTATIDEVGTSESKGMAEVNLALIPFFRYDVVFDLAGGRVGFAPCTPAFVASTEPIPTLSSWAMGLLAAGLALFGAIALSMRSPQGAGRRR
jgi:hypothetical protein